MPHVFAHFREKISSLLKKNCNPPYADGILLSVTLGILALLAYTLIRANVLFEVDGYYHIAVTKLTLEHGFMNSFPWAQFSVMKDHYADKDLLLHIMAMPFALFFENPVTAAKCAILLLESVFLFFLAFLLRKRVNGAVAGLVLALLFMSPTFTMYFLYFRPGTLAALFTMAGIYFLIGKRHWAVFIVGALFSLSHISSFTLIYFAVMCEAVRWFHSREFFFKNILFSFLGVAAGILVHPNFPNNMLAIYINAFLTPIYAAADKGINFAGELYAADTKDALFDNFPVFGVFLTLLLAGFVRNVKYSLSTAVYFGATVTYFLLAMKGNRFWFPAVPLAVLTLGSFAGDWNETSADATPKERTNAFILWLVWLCAAGVFFPYSVKDLNKRIKTKTKFSEDYVQAGKWMNANLPKGEVIYHSVWADSPYFICYNPGDYYLAVLDPIYTYYWSPDIQRISQELYYGTHKNPYEEIRRTFKARYGFTRKDTGFYESIKRDSRFKPLHESASSLIFELLPPPAGPIKVSG
ncbi:MAG: hypothetical protein WCS77_09425 [Elusimicrobiaceae bacterium]